MTTGSIVFKASCVKTLSGVEARPEKSNQHEFNGVQALKNLFGLNSFNKTAIFSLRGTNRECVAGVTWYDAREAHPTRTEHRLYFQANPVMNLAEAGDNVIVGYDRSDRLHCVLIKTSSVDHTGTINGWVDS